MNDQLSVIGRRRIPMTLFWIVAILVTAFAWSGLSLRQLLAAVAF